MTKTIKTALLNSSTTTLYIILVASFMYFLQSNLSQKPDNILMPISMLLLFVFSAAFTGSLVFGKPIILYLDNKKKEALSLIIYTLFFLLIITLMIFLILIYFTI